MSPESVYNFFKFLELDKVIIIDDEFHFNLPVTQRTVNSLRSTFNGFVILKVMITRLKVNFNVELIQLFGVHLDEDIRNNIACGIGIQLGQG